MQAVSDAFSFYEFLRGFSTDLDEIWHGQSVGVSIFAILASFLYGNLKGYWAFFILSYYNL